MKHRKIQGYRQNNFIEKLKVARKAPLRKLKKIALLTSVRLYNFQWVTQSITYIDLVRLSILNRYTQNLPRILSPAWQTGTIQTGKLDPGLHCEHCKSYWYYTTWSLAYASCFLVHGWSFNLKDIVRRDASLQFTIWISRICRNWKVMRLLSTSLWAVHLYDRAIFSVSIV